MIKELIQLANHLDNKGFTKQADELDEIIKKISAEGGEDEYDRFIRPRLQEFLKMQDERRDGPQAEPSDSVEDS